MNTDCACAMHARTSAATNELSISMRIDAFGLSRREIEVARLVGKGATNKQIALALVIGTQAVKKHVTRILQKTQSDNRTSAALKLAGYL